MYEHKNFVSIWIYEKKNSCELSKNVHYHKIPEIDYYSVTNIINSHKDKVFNENKSSSKQ